MYKRALVSVFDKSGLEGFLRPLANHGLEIFSTGGTSLFLKSKGFQVTDVEALTSFPELLSGRVKTLHPHIYMALLARHWEKSDQKALEQRGIRPFDLLVGNLYPFEKEEAGREDRELAEWIDVGGPGFLRAGAKNYFSVTVVCDPEDYKEVQKGTNLQQRKKLAVKVFKRLSQYDQFIAKRLNGEVVAGSHFRRQDGFFKDVYQKAKGFRSDFTRKSHFSKGIYQKAKNFRSDFVRKGRFFKELSYGENPHQKADWHITETRGLHEAEIIQGKALSYNNILDFSAAVLAVRNFSMPCALAVKHNSPCGAGWADSLSVAVKKALQADPLSTFGGIMALNREMDESSAELIEGLFLEGLIAPGFSASALNRAKKKKEFKTLEMAGHAHHLFAFKFCS